MKKRLIPFALICALLLAALPMTAAAANIGDFEDVSDSDYFARAVEWALDWGVTNGTSDTTFSPELQCTRAQVVTFLWRAHGEPEPSTGYNPFADVPSGSWFERAAVWAVEEGITTGTSEVPKLFSPDEPCTYAEILTFIWRAKGSPAADFASPLTAGHENEYYAPAVDWAYGNAMLEDEDFDAFDPDRPCDRGRTVAWLWRESTVYVSTAEDFMAAIGPGRQIFLAPGTYNLSEWANAVAHDTLGNTGNPYVKLDLVHDGYEILIIGVRNLSIETGGALTEGTAEIVVEPRYANVLTFLDCDRVLLADLVMGHTPDKGNCTGGVVRFADCGRVALTGMDLYGCGTYGVIAERCESVLALYSVIRDCSYGLLSLVDVPDAGFAFCEFRDSEGYDMVGLRDGSSAVFQTCSFVNNSWEEKWSHFLSMDESSDITFRDCAFDQRAYYDLTGGMDGMNVTLEAPTVF